MKLIPNFKITPFTRIAWVSSVAKENWESVILQCSTMVHNLEIESVAAGQRACAWSTISRQQLPDFVRSCADKGLIAMPVRWVGEYPGNGFLHYTPQGDAQAYCIISKKLDDAIRFRDAYEANDHEIQGEMLGFPKCCREFFAQEWKAGFFDPVWQSARAELYGSAGARRLAEIDNAHPYSNPLLRYIGLRVGFHIPCSFHCNETIAIGIERLSTAKNQTLVKLLQALLSMPMKAELFHGILTVQTPIFHLIQYSVPTENKYTIRVNGSFMPKEGNHV